MRRPEALAAPNLVRLCEAVLVAALMVLLAPTAAGALGPPSQADGTLLVLGEGRT